jgi:hypothetical protein
MDFFKNGSGWCKRHNPNRKFVEVTRAHAPVFRKKEAISDKRQAVVRSKFQASSSKLGKFQITGVKPQAASFKLQAASIKLPDL